VNGTERLLTEREVADYLALSPRTVRRLRTAGELPCVLLRSRSRPTVRYRPEDLSRWVAARATAGELDSDDPPGAPAPDFMAAAFDLAKRGA
jgi:excisionase family DNA binding protein